MPDPTSDQAWVDRWKRVGPLLEQIKWEELRAFRHEDQIELIDALLSLGFPSATPRTTSGLVEQQRIFQKARR